MKRQQYKEVEYEVISYRGKTNYFTGYGCKHMARYFQNFHYADGTIELTRTETAIQITAIGSVVFLLYQLLGGASIITKILGVCGVSSWITKILSCKLCDLIKEKTFG